MGYTKKGKEFFKLTSSLTETILNIVVDDTKIWTGCEYIYNLYDNGQDTAFYMCRHQINSLLVERVMSETDLDVVLGCQDSKIRLIQGSQLALEIPVLAPVSVVASMWEQSKAKQGHVSLLYGTETGALGVVDVGKKANKSLWQIHDGVEKSAITCLKVHDLLRDGCDAIMLGRNDGRLEVYVQNSDPEAESPEPLKVFEKDFGMPHAPPLPSPLLTPNHRYFLRLVCSVFVCEGESIRSLECGAVNTPEYNEVGAPQKPLFP